MNEVDKTKFIGSMARTMSNVAIGQCDISSTRMVGQKNTQVRHSHMVEIVAVSFSCETVV